MRAELESIRHQLAEAEQLLNRAVDTATKQPHNYLAVCSRIQAMQTKIGGLAGRVQDLIASKQKSQQAIADLNKLPAHQLDRIKAAL